MHFAIGTVRYVGAVLLCLCLHQACAAHKFTVLHPVLGKPVPTLQAAVPTALRIAKKHRSTGAFFALCFPPETHSAGFGFCAQAGGEHHKAARPAFFAPVIQFGSGRGSFTHSPRHGAFLTHCAPRQRYVHKKPGVFCRTPGSRVAFSKTLLHDHPIAGLACFFAYHPYK